VSFSQEEFVDDVYRVMRDEAVPLSLDRQLHFVNFTSFDKQSPTFINLIREPADKALSRLTILLCLFYNQTTCHSRSFYNNKQSDSDDLIQCLIQEKTNCSGAKINPHHLTVPYFCGHDPKCL
jgi:dermatan/chondrotin sulfate uronyl 2-O-sulfotransferase UST